MLNLIGIITKSGAVVLGLTILTSAIIVSSPRSRAAVATSQNINGNNNSTRSNGNQETRELAEKNLRKQAIRPFTPEEQAGIVNRLFVTLRSAEKETKDFLPLFSRGIAGAEALGSSKEKIRVLSVSNAPLNKNLVDSASDKGLAQVMLFNYTRGVATRFTVEPSTGNVLEAEVLRGQPQASREEIVEATLITKRDATVAPLISVGSIIEGGFIVPAPTGSLPRHRFIQMQVLNPTRQAIQRVVIVNLTTSTVALSRARQPLTTN